jgi:hypothetical protein
MKWALAAVALAAASSPTCAADPLPTREAFSCDSPGGRYDSYERTLVSTKMIVEATVTINEIRPDPRWWPVANVYFATENQADYVGLSFVIEKGASMATAYARFAGQKDRFAKPMGSFKIAQSVAVRIELDGSRSKLTVAGKELDGSGLAARPVTMLFSCSSVDAHIHDVRVTEHS